SSVRVCLRVMGRLSGGAAERRKAGDAWACRLPWKLAWLPRRARDGRSVQALALGDVARGAARLALHGSRGLALALLGRLLVVLALAGLGQDAGLLAGALEAAQGKLERLVFADFDAGHGISGGGFRRPEHGEPHMIARARAGPQAGGCLPGRGGDLRRRHRHPVRMRVLGIETSCDETGVAVYDTDIGGAAGLRAQAVYSQVALHAEYGGVVPELASRDHVRKLLPL